MGGVASSDFCQNRHLSVAAETRSFCCSPPMCMPWSANKISAPSPFVSTRLLTCSAMMWLFGRSATVSPSLQWIIKTFKPASTPRRASGEIGFALGLFRKGRVDWLGFIELILRAVTTSAAKAASSSTRCLGLRCPYRRLSGLSAGQEHSINIVDKIAGIFGAAARHTLIVRGLAAMLSGSTSPKNRNSCLLKSWRRNRAAES